MDLFQPVTSSQPPPPAATVTDQPVTPVDGLNQEGELFAATPQSGYVPGARRRADRGAGLILGTPGAVIALVASAALVLVAAGMTMFTTSSPTESPVGALTPGRLAAPITPAISDEHLVTVPPLDAPAGFARQTPTKAYSPKPPPAPAHQQALPTAHRAVPASPAPPPAPDHEPLLPPPSSPPSPVTAQDVGYRTITPGSYRGNTEPQTTDTEPCNCDSTMRKIPNHGDRPSKADRQRELRAQRPGYRSTSTAQKESRVNEEGQQDR
ncbi:MAG: hypothetical protein LC749_03650, partial [Actinobacteria bacterium]|nr:hypothetical protein [Actinomycetota bacterium]